MSEKSHVLVVDDDAGCRLALHKYLLSCQYTVTCVKDGKEALDLQEQKKFDAILLDLRLPDMDGMNLLTRIGSNSHRPCVIVMTGYGSIESSIEAIKRGAFHYITKPFRLEEVHNLLEKALGHQKLEKQNTIYQRQLKAHFKFEDLIGKSTAMRQVFEIIQKVASSNCTVLILGESGSGKELVASAIHYNSHRADKPFITVNCGAIPEALLESELFGHTRGSFTGAVADRMGRFEMADGGTLFLDEIGNMPLNLQVKLLRVLQSKTIDPVGGKNKSIDVRILAATNIDIEKAVKRKTFREDLYYRLNVIPILIPSLRERREDIPLLVRHFVESFNQRQNNHQKRILGLSEEAMNALCYYSWQGNVRELENVLERTMILKDGGRIEIKDLPMSLFRKEDSLVFNELYIPELGVDFNKAVEDFENTIINTVLNRTSGNKKRAASMLNLKRTTLIEKLKRKRILPSS
ncbi:MAG: sigma-54-dependent Fis family transcriptional regulator [Deltaproteobacteria bacterium]|nr:sigma-54-dependent Fis family transcriptional regulator [Deltaproteobacteria bacterium]